MAIPKLIPKKMTNVHAGVAGARMGESVAINRSIRCSATECAHHRSTFISSLPLMLHTDRSNGAKSGQGSIVSLKEDASVPKVDLVGPS